jgi:hypothetical protein
MSFATESGLSYVACLTGEAVCVCVCVCVCVYTALQGC